MERMTAAAFRRNRNPKNKFGAKPTEVNGIRFDSKHEAKRYGELLVLEREGKIRDLEVQVPIKLQGRDGPLKTRTGRPMRLTLDFSYVDTETGLTVYEDAKGKPTRDYEVRKAVAEAMGIEVTEV